MKTILMVEDDSNLRRIVRDYLEPLEIEVVEAWTVADALDACASEAFDAVMLDYNITDGDVGWDLAREIRGDPDLYHEPKIIAMSGTVDVDEIETLGFSPYEFDAILAKPFELATLERHLAELLDL